MAGVIATVFMTVMIGSTSGDAAPVVTKETTVIQGYSSMMVCRKLESNFHQGALTINGETKTSSTMKAMVGYVQRESSCTEIRE